LVKGSPTGGRGGYGGAGVGANWAEWLKNTPFSEPRRRTWSGSTIPHCLIFSRASQMRKRKTACRR
jgi:hypothetical protein